MVTNLPCSAGGAGLIPGRGTKTPHAATSPLCCNYWAPMLWGLMSQLWDHVLHNERFHVMPSYRASGGGIWALTDSAATKKGPSVPERSHGVTHRPNQSRVPALWERKTHQSAQRWGIQVQDNKTEQDSCKTRESHSGCSWRNVPGWEARAGVGSHRAESWDGGNRQMDTDHTEQQPRQPDCPFLTKLTDNR